MESLSYDLMMVMALEAGAHLGPYEILKPLGAGGMGEVYRARDPRLEREVAIKVLPQHLTRDPESLNRFQREAKVLAALSHPNILSIYDVGTHDEISYVVTELLEGETLHSRIQASPLPWRDATEIAIAVSEGLAAAHSKGIIHRDLKPENVFLSNLGLVKILDFGLAKVEGLRGSGDQSLLQTVANTSPGVLVGTVQYMSPEQVRGMIADARSDLFAFGCLLYEMLTGRRPFTGSSLVETLVAILRDPFPEMTGLSGRIPAALVQVIHACLQKKPEDRIQTARELSVALRAVASGSAVWDAVPASTRKRKSKAIDSLAILPFVNMTEDSEIEYLADGLAESLIDSLSQLPKLRVMARTTVFRYKGRDVDPLVVGKELNVRSVLSGRVFQKGETLAIQTELVDVHDGARLWGNQYSCDSCNILQLQADLSGQISEHLRIKLLQRERKQLKKKYTENEEAYRLYLKGRYYWGKRTLDGFQRALDLFDQAAQQDPKFALAYSGLADTYGLLGGFGYIPPIEAYSRARVEAMKALELDPQLAEAHTSLATVKYRLDWDWEGAEQEFRKAILCNPGYATAYHWFGVYLVLMGRFEEGHEHVERAAQLDPLSLVINWTRGYVLYYMHRYDEAIDQYRRTLGLDPTFARVHIDIGLAYLLKGEHRKGIEEVQKGLSLMEQNPGLLGSLGYAYAMAGDRVEATKILEDLLELSKRQYISPFSVTLIHSALGNTDEAFAWLEKSLEQKEDAMVSLKVNPRLDSLRSDHRFEALLQRVGLK